MFTDDFRRVAQESGRGNLDRACWTDFKGAEKSGALDLVEKALEARVEGKDWKVEQTSAADVSVRPSALYFLYFIEAFLDHEEDFGHFCPFGEKFFSRPTFLGWSPFF